MISKSAPCVSVIVPVYNTEKYLHECLSSLCGQTLKNIEIICVNDGSTDNSSLIIEEFASRDPRIRYVDRINSGVSEARKAGILCARGEYIGFIDSDDYVNPEYFELLYEAACKEDADMAATSGIVHFDEKKSWKAYVFIGESKSLSPLQRGQFIFSTTVPWNKILKRELCHSALPYYVCIATRMEDLMLSAPAVFKAKKITLISGAKYYYRQHKDSISHLPEFPLADLLNIYYMFIVLINYVKKFGIEKSVSSVYIKELMRTRDYWCCFCLVNAFPSISQSISFFLQTKDSKLMGKWIFWKIRRALSSIKVLKKLYRKLKAFRKG